MNTIDWDESRLIALRLSSQTTQEFNNTRGRTVTMNGVSMSLPTTPASDLDSLQLILAQKMLDFLTSDQFDGSLLLRAQALEAAVTHRHARNLLDAVAEDPQVQSFAQTYAPQPPSTGGKAQKSAQKSSREDQMNNRLARMEVLRRNKPFGLPVKNLLKVWHGVIDEILHRAENLVNIGASYTKPAHEPTTTQSQLTLQDLRAHQQSGSPKLK